MLKQISSSNLRKLRTWSVVYVHACYAMLWPSLVKTNKFILYVYMHAKFILYVYMHAMPCYELHCLLSYGVIKVIMHAYYLCRIQIHA